jgi:transcriptional regulator with XRE-family HTH domain
MNEKARFGICLKTIRLRRGLTQEDLAELIDRSVDSISNMERGVSAPSYETLTRLAEKLGVPVEALSGKDEPVTRGRSAASPERVELQAELADLARTLDDTLLKIAVEQIQVLARYVKK